MATIYTAIIDPDEQSGVDYASMDLFEEDFGGFAEDSSSTDLDTDYVTPGDLTTVVDGAEGAGAIVVGECRCDVSAGNRTADSTPVAFLTANWVTDVNDYIHITAHADHMASTQWDETIYRIEHSSNFTINNTVPFTRFTGLQVGVAYTGASHKKAFYGSGIGTLCDRCLTRHTGTTSGDATGFSLSGGTTAAPNLFRNCIAYDFNKYGFALSSANAASSIAHACTAVDSGTGFYSSYNDGVARNCLAFGCTSAGFGGTFNTTDAGTKNASDDNDAPGTNPINLTGEAGTDVFVDYSNDDFAIKDHEQLANDGYPDLHDYATLPVPIDIDGVTRSESAPSVGAFEYVAAGGTEANAVGTIVLGGSIDTNKGQQVNAVGTIVLNGSIDTNKGQQANAVGTIVLNGSIDTNKGQQTNAVGTLILNGSVDANNVQSGITEANAVGVIVLSGSVDADKGSQANAVGTIVLGGSVDTNKGQQANAVGTLVLNGSVDTNIGKQANAVGTLILSGSVDSTTVPEGATEANAVGTLVLSGSVDADRGTQANAVGVLVLGGSVDTSTPAVKMYIIACFSNNGVPATGLSPTVDIWKVDGTQVITGNGMTEVAGGFYQYGFTSYDELEDYCIRADGTATLSNADRYVYSSNESVLFAKLQSTHNLAEVLLGIGTVGPA